MQLGPYSFESTVRKLEREDPATVGSPRDQSRLGVSKYSAYNLTRERFLSAEVEAADFSSASLNTRLPALTPGCDTALWIQPFRGISPTSVRIPIDLVYLDESFVVLNAVESFPICQASASGAPPASVLALPANTISSSETQTGDRLILCPPEELKQRLLFAAGTKMNVHAEQGLYRAPDAAVRKDKPANKAPDNLLEWVDHIHRAEHARPEPSRIEDPPPEPPPMAVPPPPQPEPAQPAIIEAQAPKNWFHRLFFPEPPDPRSAPRESLSWLAAYFFTGGTPAAHPIRDISSTGFYVYTEERWYLGTVIRVTLTDRQQPTAQRTFTANAKVVRWGSDGVGLEFVLKEKKEPRRGKDPAPASSIDDIGRFDVEQFLQMVRTSAG